MQDTPPPPRISALIVSNNQAAALRRSLAALEKSRNRELMEIILVDNGSTDGSPSLDTDFPNITVLRLPRNFGSTKALNIGIRTAVGEYLLLLEPETEVSPDTVALLAARLDREAEASAVCPLLTSPADEPVSRILPLPTADYFHAVCRGSAPEGRPVDPALEAVSNPYPGRRAILVRRQFMKGMNYFDERYGEYWADAELAWQIARASRKALVLTAARAIYHPRAAASSDPGIRASLSADCALGAAAYLSKHNGFMAGLAFRFRVLLSVIGSMFVFNDPGFQFRRLSAILAGRKIDGSQGW